MKTTQNIAGRFLFVSLVGCAGVMVRTAAAMNGLSDEAGMLAAIAATAALAWYACHRWIDDRFAVAVGIAAKTAYAPVVGWLLYRIAFEDAYELGTLLLTVSATGVAAWMGSDRESMCEVETDGRTIACAFVAMFCQIALMSVEASVAAVERSLQIVGLALLVSLFFVARHGWPRSAPRVA